jgi:hypothetical protein
LIKLQAFSEYCTITGDVPQSDFFSVGTYSWGTTEFAIDLKGIWQRAANYFGRSSADLLYAVALDVETGMPFTLDDRHPIAFAEVNEIRVVYTQQNDAGTGVDAGNDFSSATLITQGTYLGELYSPYDTEDWYQFNVLSDHVISLGVIPPAGADIDIRLYNPAGTLKASAIGIANYIDFRADSNGAWRVQLFIAAGEGQYSFDLSLIPISDGGGGCPYVSTWNGSRYVLDNNLIPAAEYSNGSDVTDYYRLQKLPTREEGKYSLLIWDLDKHSFLDEAKLIAIDHESDVNVAVSPFGEILTYETPTPPQTALTKNGTNIISLLADQDGQYYEGYEGDYIQLDFSGADIQNGAKLVINSDYCALPPCAVEKSPVHIQIFNSSGIWHTLATIYPRVYWATDIINLSNYLPDGNGELKVRVSFTSQDRIDYIGLDTTKQGEFELSYANLAKANHMRLGDVKELLQNSDNLRVELLPGEEVTLHFTLPQNFKEERDFIIILEGHYFKVD